MEVRCVHLLLAVLLMLKLAIPASFQRVEGRHLRPYPVPKCDRYDRCGGQGGYDQVDRDDFKSDRDKDKTPEATRDDWPMPTGGGRPGVGSDIKPDPVDYDSKVTSTGSVRHIPKPVADRDDYDIKPPVSGGGGYNRKPDRDEYNPKPSGGGSGGGGYNLKPDLGKDDYDPNPPGTGAGGYNRRPGTNNPKPVVTGGGSGGGYNRKPVSGGGYNPKPVVDRDEIDRKPFVGGGGYNPKPVNDGYNPKPVDDDYNVKPVGTGGEGYKPKPNRGGGGGGGGGYYPRPDVHDPNHRPDRKDLGGYDNPKDDDYNEGDYVDGSKDDDYVGGLKPEPVVDGNCICVPYYQCLDGHIVTDGEGIIDARKRPEPEEDGKFKPPSCGPFHVCCNTPETSTVIPYEHRCGVRNPSGINSRILSPSNEGEADFGEWPWQAAILKAEGTVNMFQCGGVLIDKYHVLTVAHCVFHLYKYNEYPLKVRLGEWDTQTTSEFLAHEDYKVSKIIVHPEFRNTSLWNDVAILRLEDPILFAPHIDTVCLPQYDEIFSEQNCVVTGWGKDAFKGSRFSNVMKEVALQVIDNYKCEEMLRKTRLGRFFQLHEGFLCAGGEYGLDSCKGDGGGPLVCYRKDKSYALAGIVSWGIDCGQPGVPGVYVKIQKYLEWISKSTGVNLQEYWPKY